MTSFSRNLVSLCAISERWKLPLKQSKLTDLERFRKQAQVWALQICTAKHMQRYTFFIPYFDPMHYRNNGWFFPSLYFAQFDLNFVNEETQEEMSRIFPERLNLINPLDCGLDYGINMDKCPPANPTDGFWASFPYRDLKKWRKAKPVHIPKLDFEEYYVLLFWLLSPYRYFL